MFCSGSKKNYIHFCLRNPYDKEDLNDTRYIYTLLCFVKLIKLYLESKIQHITTAEYSHENCTTKIVPIASLKWQLNLKKLVKFTWNAIDMWIKHCRKQPNIQQSRLLSANQNIESVFLNRQLFSVFVCFVYFVYWFNIFHFYMVTFSLLYLAQIFRKSFIQMGQLRGAFRAQSNIEDWAFCKNS